MAKTLLQARTLLRSFLDEASASDWQDSELNLLLNSYYHRVRSFVITSYEDYYMTTATLNSTANQEEYTSTDGVPTDILKIRRVELNFDVTASSGAPTRMFPISNMDGVRRDLGFVNAGVGMLATGGAGYYSYGFGSNFVIGFIPKPQNPGGSGTNAIKIWYVREEPDLASDTSTFSLPYADRNYMNIVYGATGDALRFSSQDLQGAKEFDQKYEMGVMKMQEELGERIAEEAKMTIDQSGSNLNFDGPY